MKRIIPFILLILLSVSTMNFSQERGFGAGIIIGEPTGLSGKLWLLGGNALDMAAAWSFKGNGALLLQADYVFHTFNLIKVESGKLPLYYGIGGRIILHDNDTYLGIRVPVGLDYMFNNAPVDIFVEIVPILDLTPATDFDIGAGIGVRYWFY